MTYNLKYPFSNAVSLLNSAGMTFAQMESKSRYARSAGWWNKQVRDESNNPPPPRLLPRIAEMMGRAEREVAELICAEWYGVRGSDDVPDELRPTVGKLKQLEAEDRVLVGALVDSLDKKRRNRPS
ncbi:hypothetical protein PUR61_16170 [Streptomyces sp. BE20]|uniref:hypothetical protein n=1 Tax=Streptomyces sp. BE20 TaxID=3002525 RepID=UPI002E77413F|nr:hypothetical protein [Streptomyces sp. BE20]MEE1823715.1 hypothetical protein [Streptomyces sp. BE20]